MSFIIMIAIDKSFYNHTGQASHAATAIFRLNAVRLGMAWNSARTVGHNDAFSQEAIAAQQLTMSGWMTKLGIR